MLWSICSLSSGMCESIGKWYGSVASIEEVGVEKTRLMSAKSEKVVWRLEISSRRLAICSLKVLIQAMGVEVSHNELVTTGVE